MSDVVKQKKKALRRMKGGKVQWQAYLYLLPAILVIGLFVIYPMIKILRMGFYEKYTFITDEGSGFGLKSFAYVLKHRPFKMAVSNTLIIVCIGTPITLALSLGAAVLINSQKKLRGFCHMSRRRWPLVSSSAGCSTPSTVTSISSLSCLDWSR